MFIYQDNNNNSNTHKNAIDRGTGGSSGKSLKRTASTLTNSNTKFLRDLGFKVRQHKKLKKQ